MLLSKLVFIVIVAFMPLRNFLKISRTPKEKRTKPATAGIVLISSLSALSGALMVYFDLLS